MQTMEIKVDDNYDIFSKKTPKKPLYQSTLWSSNCLFFKLAIGKFKAASLIKIVATACSKSNHSSTAKKTN